MKKMNYLWAILLFVSCASVNQDTVNKLSTKSEVKAYWDRGSESSNLEYKVGNKKLNRAEVAAFLDRSKNKGVIQSMQDMRKIKNISNYLLYGSILALLVGQGHASAQDGGGYSKAQREWNTLGLGLLGISFGVGPLQYIHLENARNRHNQSLGKKSLSFNYSTEF
jgi:hypothetical protein